MIEKVQIINRKFIPDERGWFVKVVIGQEDGMRSHVGEVYLTMGNPGQSKGGHYHINTREWFYLLEGRAVLKLEDVKTKERREIEMTCDCAQSVYVPEMVAHIFENVGETRFVVLAYADLAYDPEDTEEYTFR